MKKLFLIPLFSSLILLSACSVGNSAYNYSTIDSDSSEVFDASYNSTKDNNVDDNIKEDNSEDSSTSKEEKSDLSSVSFADLKEKEKKSVKKEIRTLFGNYFNVEPSSYTNDSIDKIINTISSYGLILKDKSNNSIFLNEDAILDLVDLFTEDLKRDVQEK